MMGEIISARFLTKLQLCPLCSSEQRKFLWRAGDASVYRCLSCGLAYLDPALDSEGMAAAYASTESLKQLHDFHEGYYEYTDLNKPTRTRAEFLKHLGTLNRILPAGAPRTILDVGYGNGMFLALAEKNGWKADGIDTSAQNEASAKKNYGLVLKAGFFQDANFKAKFSAVSMLDVIEHQVNPHLFVREASRVLMSGGLLLLAAPHENSFLRFLSQAFFALSLGKINQGLKMVYVLEHVAYYNRKTLTQLLEVNGFEVVKVYFTSTDLAKYGLGPFRRVVGEIILFFGKIFGLQNRITIIGRKKA